MGVVALGADGRVLLVDHYRFMTDSRSWELPAGQTHHVDPRVNADGGEQEDGEQANHVYFVTLDPCLVVSS